MMALKNLLLWWVKTDCRTLSRCAALKIDIEFLPDTLSRPEKEAIIYWIAKKKHLK
jgi:hypothetical protein